MKRTWPILLAVAVATVAALLFFRRPSAPPFDMVAKLASIARAEDVWDNQWDRPKEKIAALQASLKTERDPIKLFQIRREIARHRLYDGANEEAIEELRILQEDYASQMPPAIAESLKAELAFAWFRLGEMQNCALHHNERSCLLPVEGKGVHLDQRGSAEAVKAYAALLADPKTDPENALSYRWLLNLGYMTLGGYPSQVPPRWLIPPQTFKSDFDISRFPEVAASKGIAEFGAAGGVILEDFDNDGHLDLMISHMGIADQLEYFHNNGDGTFTRRTREAGLEGIVGGLNLFQADYDNDGCIDVFIPRGAWLHDHGQFPASLLHNNCDGTFTDVTAKAGLLQSGPSQVAAFADVNNDGYLDLFVGYEIDRKNVAWPAGTRNFTLYLNNQDGTFTDASAQSGIDLEGMVKGAVFGDIDNDGWQDLYVSIFGRPNRLYRNNGAASGPRFTDVTARAGVAEPLMSFTCWFFDYNNDGWPDLFVAGYSATLPNVVTEVTTGEQAPGERPRLYRNNQDGTFTDVSHEAHLDKLLLTMGANFGDLDNDGWLDFYLGTGSPSLSMLVPNRMFRNHQGQFFQDVTTSGGFGHLQKGHAVAFGDTTGSGNQDVVEVMGGVYPSDKFWTALYQNPGHGNHWIKLNLIGVKANRFAVGARIRMVVAGENGAPREIYSTVSSGGSFGASSLRPHLGVGKATTIDLLEIKWPGSGTVQRFEKLAADKTWEIREDRAQAREVHLLTSVYRPGPSATPEIREVAPPGQRTVIDSTAGQLPSPKKALGSSKD